MSKVKGIPKEDQDLMDWEADVFAGAFLMPEKELVKKISEGFDIEDLAEYFNVQPIRVIQRLEILKEIKRQEMQGDTGNHQ